ncbi:MAG: hypothetical protein JW740_03505 [Candidatus Zambryskibacteria bacterium]|nr:hypothetical protein [Candidatus Zambryskibacteria bacterium]
MFRRDEMFLKRFFLFSVILLLILFLAGCKTTASTSDDIPSAGDILLPESTEQLINMAKADLAQRLRMTESEIQLSSVEEVDFPDTSLGVPETGKFYAEVITPGFIIKLEAQGQVYQYNTDRDDTVKIYTINENTNLEDITFPVDYKQIDDGKPWMPVD